MEKIASLISATLGFSFFIMGLMILQNPGYPVVEHSVMGAICLLMGCGLFGAAAFFASGPGD